MAMTKQAGIGVAILGAGGFIGRKLAAHIAASGRIGERQVGRLTLFDLSPPAAPEASAVPVTTLGGDIVALPPDAIPADTQVIFHLAAVVSAAAEQDYELGRRVNLGGIDALIDACRRLPAPPRVVFTSSIASFTGGQDALLDDDARQLPANSYGAQKAVGELLLADASRRGFLDALSLRLPTVAVRPGRPNQAASSFVSAIVREPLLGLPAELPVADDFAIWIASPRRVVDWLLHAASLDTAGMGVDRSLSLPGISATVGDLLRELEAVRPGAGALVHRVENPAIAAIVNAWPAAFTASRALALGFAPHESVGALVRAFVADDLAVTRRERGL